MATQQEDPNNPMSWGVLDSVQQPLAGAEDEPLPDVQTYDDIPDQVVEDLFQQQIGMDIDLTGLKVESQEDFDRLAPGVQAYLNAIKPPQFGGLGMKFTRTDAAKFILEEQRKAMERSNNMIPPKIVESSGPGGVKEIYRVHPSAKPEKVTLPIERTTRGTVVAISPTNTAWLAMPDGGVAQNYTAGPMSAFFGGQMGGAPISQYNAQQTPTNAMQAPAPAPQAAAPQAVAPNTAVNQVAPPTVAPPPQAAVQGTVRVMAPNGQTGSIPANQLEQALREGYQQIQ
jgi:hypothetical protein